MLLLKIILRSKRKIRPSSSKRKRMPKSLRKSVEKGKKLVRISLWRKRIIQSMRSQNSKHRRSNYASH